MLPESYLETKDIMIFIYLKQIVVLKREVELCKIFGSWYF